MIWISRISSNQALLVGKVDELLCNVGFFSCLVAVSLFSLRKGICAECNYPVGLGSWAGVVCQCWFGVKPWCDSLCSWFYSTELIPSPSRQTLLCSPGSLGQPVSSRRLKCVINTGLVHHRDRQFIEGQKRLHFVAVCTSGWGECVLSMAPKEQKSPLTLTFLHPLVPLEDVSPECLHLSFCCSFSPAHLALLI